MAYLSHSRRRSPHDAHYYWKEDELELLRRLAADGCPTRQIALRLGRSPKAVRSKASELGVSLTHYGRELRNNYPDSEGETTVHKQRRVVVNIDFDFHTLTYDQRLALAEALRTSVPDGYVHSGGDTLMEDVMVQHMARNAGVDVPDDLALPEIDAEGEPDWRNLDATQIRELLGIPLAPVPPEPERFIPLRFRPSAPRTARAERPDDASDGSDPTACDAAAVPPRLRFKLGRLERRCLAAMAKAKEDRRQEELEGRALTPGQERHLFMLQINADAGHAWAKQELRKLKASGF